MTLPIYTTPRSDPQRVTLQADTATWSALVEALKLHRQSTLSSKVDRLVTHYGGDKAVVRIHLSLDEAAHVYRVAGVSG